MFKRILISISLFVCIITLLAIDVQAGIGDSYLRRTNLQCGALAWGYNFSSGEAIFECTLEPLHVIWECLNPTGFPGGEGESFYHDKYVDSAVEFDPEAIINKGKFPLQTEFTPEQLADALDPSCNNLWTLVVDSINILETNFIVAISECTEWDKVNEVCISGTYSDAPTAWGYATGCTLDSVPAEDGHYYYSCDSYEYFK